MSSPTAATESPAARPTDGGPLVATRDRILHATLTVIGTHGIAGLTNRLVAKQAGISLGSLTYHFTSQTDLLRESLLMFVDEETRRITAIADNLATTVNSVPAAAAAAERAIADLTMGPEEIGVYELYVQSARDPELHDAVRTCFAAYERVAVDILTLLGVGDPDALAPHVVALVAGTQLRRLATGGSDAGSIAAGLVHLIRDAG